MTLHKVQYDGERQFGWMSNWAIRLTQDVVCGGAWTDQRQEPHWKKRKEYSKEGCLLEKNVFISIDYR